MNIGINLEIQKTISPKFQNEINKSIILNYVMEDNRTIFRAKIARDLKISAPTVSKIIEDLINLGYVIEVGKKNQLGGKGPHS